MISALTTPDEATSHQAQQVNAAAFHLLVLLLVVMGRLVVNRTPACEGRFGVLDLVLNTPPSLRTVSYTHLTLPTKRIV